MSQDTKGKRAFTHFPNGYVRYNANGVMSFDISGPRYWNGLARVLSKRLDRYVPEMLAWALFCETVQSGWIRSAMT